MLSAFAVNDNNNDNDCVRSVCSILHILIDGKISRQICALLTNVYFILRCHKFKSALLVYFILSIIRAVSFCGNNRGENY